MVPIRYLTWLDNFCLPCSCITRPRHGYSTHSRSGREYHHALCSRLVRQTTEPGGTEARVRGGPQNKKLLMPAYTIHILGDSDIETQSEYHYGSEPVHLCGSYTHLVVFCVAARVWLIILPGAVAARTITISCEILWICHSHHLGILARAAATPAVAAPFWVLHADFIVRKLFHFYSRSA